MNATVPGQGPAFPLAAGRADAARGSDPEFTTLHDLAPNQGYWVHITGTVPQSWSGQ